MIGLVDRDLAHQVYPTGSLFRFRAGEKGCRIGGTECSRHRTRVTQHPCQAPRVDRPDSGDAPRNEALDQRIFCSPVAVAAGHFANDDSARERMARFVVEAGDSVVADMRLRERDDLTGIRRVGDDFLITRDCRVEHNLTCRDTIGRENTEDFPLEHVTVRKDELSLDDILRRTAHLSAPLSTTMRPSNET